MSLIKTFWNNLILISKIKIVCWINYNDNILYKKKKYNKKWQKSKRKFLCKLWLKLKNSKRKINYLINYINKNLNKNHKNLIIE